MTRECAVNICKLLEKAKNRIEKYRISEIETEEFDENGRKLKCFRNFHNWANNLEVIEAYNIIGTKTAVKILFIEWSQKHKGNFYLVIYPENRSRAKMEIHETLTKEKKFFFTWRYKPVRHDEWNEKRKNIFMDYMKINKPIVEIEIPKKEKEVEKFLDQLLRVYKYRILSEELKKYNVNNDLFLEGKKYESIHQEFERNSKLIEEAKKQSKIKYGKLVCEVCGFDFNNIYGDIGDGFIEAHHKVPLSDLGEEVENTVSDIALVCSNCHRMIHRNPQQCLTVEELKEIILKNKG